MTLNSRDSCSPDRASTGVLPCTILAICCYACNYAHPPPGESYRMLKYLLPLDTEAMLSSHIIRGTEG